MAVGGVGGSGSGAGPSRAWKSLPFKGYKEQGGWLEEWVDAIWYELDILHARFGSVAARTNLLDPTYIPTENAGQNYAILTQAPLSSANQATMLDLLCAIAGAALPIDSNFTVQQKRDLTVAFETAMKRKGNRQQILAIAAAIYPAVIAVTLPPASISVLFGDGAPSPGWGSWVPSAASVTPPFRPWVFEAARNNVGQCSPAWASLGVGYSQFRAGYSAAGEPVMPAGSTINLLNGEHFLTWTTGVPDGWTKTGAGTLTQSTSATYINWEMSGSAAVLDLTAAAMGTSIGLTQTTTAINNQVAHLFEIDYDYTNTQGVSNLIATLVDDNGRYWNAATSAWQSAPYLIPLPVTTTRSRYAITVTPSDKFTGTTVNSYGVQTVTVSVYASSDGTASTQVTYTLYRVGLYEKFSLAIEQQAFGERTLWLPLKGTRGWCRNNRTGASTIVEIADAARSRTQTVAVQAESHDYHPALSSRSLHSMSAWSNLLKGSNDFVTDWTANNCTLTQGQSSPELTSAGALNTNATQFAATGANPYNGQLNVVANPNSKTYIAGAWVKRISGTATTCTLNLITTTTKSQQFDLTSEWQLLAMSSQAMAVTDVAAMEFRIGLDSTDSVIQVYSAYVYDVTAKGSDVLYPPICQSTVGVTGTINATKALAYTQSMGSNIKHPRNYLPLVQAGRGRLVMTFVPTFGRNNAGTVPNGVMFDFARDATHNRLRLQISSNSLQLSRWDNAGNNTSISLSLSWNTAPGAGSMTWRRDVPITIIAMWDETSHSLSAGNGNVTGSGAGFSTFEDGTDATLPTAIGIGNDFAEANAIDGYVTALEVTQRGTSSE